MATVNGGCGGTDPQDPLLSWNGKYTLTWECRGEGEDCPVWPDVGRMELEIRGFGQTDDGVPRWGSAVDEGWLTLRDPGGHSEYQADLRGAIIYATTRVVETTGIEVPVTIGVGQIEDRVEGWAPGGRLGGIFSWSTSGGMRRR